MKTFKEYIEPRDNIASILNALMVEAEQNEYLIKEGFGDWLGNLFGKGLGKVRDFAGGFSRGTSAGWKSGMSANAAEQLKSIVQALEKVAGQVKGKDAADGKPLDDWLRGIAKQLNDEIVKLNAPAPVPAPEPAPVPA